MFSMFSPKPAASAPASATTPAVTPTPTPANGAGGQPAEGQVVGTNQTPANPMDVYSKLLDTAGKNGAVQAPEFKLDPAILQKASKSLDLTASIDKDMVAKALAGDAGSLVELIKQVGQNSYQHAMEHNSALTGAFLDKRGEYERAQLNSGVREQLTQNTLAANAPNYSHPVVKAELNRIASQIAQSNPDASPAEVAKTAQQYINDLASALAPAQQATTTGKPGGAEMDWSKYLDQ